LPDRQGALLYRGSGDALAAAEAFEQAGAAAEAAASYEAAGKPAQAARILEAALRAARADDLDGLRVKLGRLYARHRKHEAAVRVLQQLTAGSERRREGLVVLAQSLEALGLEQPLRDLAPELAERAITRAEVEADDAAAPADALLFGRYRIAREVATTPHARLVEAVDQLDGERVAVKILASRSHGTGRDAVARFAREAQALDKLRHPNVVPLRAYLPDGPAMVLKWMGGGSLRDLVDRESISPARAAEIVRGVLDALGEAHRMGILHRDIKPENLLFDEGGTARLADFGAAHLAASETTVTVGEIGTAAYMAPEQRAGQAATVASDLYAVGVIFFEMLTGELPSAGRSVAPSHPDLEEAHDAVVQRFLAPQPDGRYDSALSARRAVEALIWPSRMVARPLPTREVAIVANEERLEPARRRGDAHDTWLGRDVLLVPIGEIDRVAAFARADHPALPTVLRVDREAGQIWIEAPRGRPLSQGLRVGAAERSVLREALEALHRAGGSHGHVDAEHVHIHAGSVTLAFPRSAPAGTRDADLEALASLP
jgi:eukaryotic-like serine/threonine-protein kinase